MAGGNQCSKCTHARGAPTCTMTDHDHDHGNGHGHGMTMSADYLNMNSLHQQQDGNASLRRRDSGSQSSGPSASNNDNHRPSPLETETVISASASSPPMPMPMPVKAASSNMPNKQSSILGASSNLVNSIVGAGIIGIPYALRMSGLVAGTLLLLLVAIMTDKSLRLLIEQAYFHPKLRHLNIRTYEELASYPFGTMGSGFVLSGMFVMAYGAMVAYLLIIKDTIPTMLGYEHGTHTLERNFILLSTSLVIVVPLSMQRDMASLSFSSAISVAADVVLVVFIAAFSPVKETVEANGGIGQVFANDGINSTLFIGLGILSTAMACQHSAFIVSDSLCNKTRKRWRWVTNQSIALSATLCLILGISGYLGFLGMTQGDVLNNFEHDSMQANAARLLLAFTMFLTYPMESFVARHVLVMLMHNGDMDAHPPDHGGEDVRGAGGGFSVENEERIEREEFGEGTERAIVEGGGILCMNRRQTWTLAIYLVSVLTLVSLLL